MTTYTLRESVLNAIVAIAGTVPNATAYRSREAAFAREEGTAILVRPDEETVERNASLMALRDLTFTATVIARGPIPDTVADAAIAAFHAALMADDTLGGLVARTIEESSKWEFEVADQNAVAVELRYRCRYLTQTNTLTAHA